MDIPSPRQPRLTDFAFSHPAPSQILWRYCKFEHLGTILKNKAIYLRNASKYQDKLEGTLNFLTEREFTAYCLKRKIYGSDRNKLWEQYLVDRWVTFVSCWRADLEECSRAWVEYEADIAIKSKFMTLQDAIASSFGQAGEEIRYGMIQYIDRLTQKIPFSDRFYPVMLKSLAFEWEKEFRVVWRVDQFYESVAHQLINLNKDTPEVESAVGLPIRENIIEEIVLAPGHDISLYDKVQNMIEEAGINASVSFSQCDKVSLAV